MRRRREAYERLFGGSNAATPARISSDGVVPEFAGDIALLETDALEAWVAGVKPRGAAKADENGVVNMAEDSDDDDATAVVTGGGVVWGTPMPARCQRRPAAAVGETLGKSAAALRAQLFETGGAPPF